MSEVNLQGGRRLAARHSRRPRWRGPVLSALAAAVVVAAVVGAWWLWRTTYITVSLDGTELRLRKGATVEAALAGRPRGDLWGDLIAVDGKVLAAGKGRPPAVRSGDATLALSSVLGDGQSLAVTRGADLTEPAKRTATETPAPVRVVGRGPFIVRERPGVPLRVVTLVGEISGVTLKDHRETSPVAAVIRRQSVRVDEDVVSLTFDDGPNPVYTPQVLDILKRHEIKATFFVLGAAAARYPALAERIVEEGHQIASHSYYHLNWDSASEKAVEEDIRWSLDAIEKATRRRPTWLRPPGGRTNMTVMRLFDRVGVDAVMWTADTHDWRRPSADDIAYRALSGTVPGAVVLMHDGGGDRSRTVAALPKILEGLKKRGYRAVTIEELWRSNGL